MKEKEIALQRACHELIVLKATVSDAVRSNLAMANGQPHSTVLAPDSQVISCLLVDKFMLVSVEIMLLIINFF
jgi:hypothetical protein